jgi:hypothetical protein
MNAKKTEIFAEFGPRCGLSLVDSWLDAAGGKLRPAPNPPAQHWWPRFVWWQPVPFLGPVQAQATSPNHVPTPIFVR